MRYLLSFLFLLISAATAFAGAPTSAPTPSELIKRLPELKDVDINIPWSDFKAMLEKMTTAPAAKPKPQPPMDYVLGQGTYTATVSGAAAQVKATIELTVLKEDGWVTIPLVGTEVALGGTKLDGKPAVVVVKDGKYQLIATGVGVHTIELTAAASVADDRGRQSFSIHIPQTAGTRFAVTVPEKDTTVSISPSADTAVVAGAKDVTVTANLPVTDTVQVNWQKKVAEPEPTTPKLYADVSTLISIGEGFLRTYNRVQYRILHAPVERLRLAVPENVTILDVTGDGIRDWKKTTEGGQDLLTVTLNYPVKDGYRLAVNLEQSLTAAAVASVPVLKALDVERERGFLGVAAEANVEVSSPTQDEARLIDVKELPPDVSAISATPLLLGFRYAKQPYRIALDIRRHEDVPVLTTIVDSATATTMQTEAGARITRLRLMIRNNQRQFLKLQMPAKVQIWSAFVSDRAVSPGRDQDGRILLPLEKSARDQTELQAFPMELIYTEDAEPIPATGRGTFKATLPAIDVPATVVVWSVFLPEDRKFGEFTGSIHPLPPQTAPEVGAPTVERTAQANQAQTAVKSQTAQQAEELRQQTLVALRRATMPIRIAIPERGQLFQFQKLLVTNEALTIAGDWRGKRTGWW